MFFSAGEALAPGGLRPRRQEVRPEPADQRDRQHVHGHREHAGNDAGDEQLADVLLGDDAVDRQHGGRRQHGAERAAGRDHAGGKRLRIAEAAHFRIGHRREGRRRRHRRAADRGEAAAGRDGRDAEPAAQMADKAVGGAEQFAAHAGIADEACPSAGTSGSRRTYSRSPCASRSGRPASAPARSRRDSRSRRRRRGPSPCRPARAAASAQTARRNPRTATASVLMRPTPPSSLWHHGYLPDGRSGGRCGSRSAARRRRRRPRRPRRTARSACACRR